MRYDKKNEYIWIDYEQIWSKLKSYFKLNYKDTRSIIKDWLEEHYNLSGITFIQTSMSQLMSLEEHYNQKINKK